MLHWANSHSTCSFLDNHQYVSAYNTVECIAAVGAMRVFKGPAAPAQIDAFFKEHRDWLFGHFAYEFGRPNLSEKHTQQLHLIGFDDACFVQPETVLQLSNHILIIDAAIADPDLIFKAICDCTVATQIAHPAITVQARTSKTDYLFIVEQLLAHILRGDCYEINFCQEFFAENVSLNPLLLYQALTKISPNPFSCYYKVNNAHLICASPERYLQKKGNILRSQPIKGTNKRNSTNAAADNELKNQLRNSTKDQIENVMVVDLVRNDLSRVCKAGTVSVEELFGIYRFPQVHQMISTVIGELKAGLGLNEIIAASFPMGSMTGAPKKKVMELIDCYEPIPRGLYSGAMGYINPSMDFDFNVVIRSMLYNTNTEYLSYHVGSGITFQSKPEEEYQECLLKAQAMNTILRQ
ncbi:MAG: anthranilate synthase component I family protein [Sphingobacteriia bacterium]|nr:MAG: anthranilate synthase component I family protein [Sphingobacteriia bacterium]TAG31538.1 MAG: anthranilate synthase component I family protein [Sphingobacteriia bacterium]